MEFVLDSIEILLLWSIPQLFSVTLFVFFFMDIRVPHYYRQLSLFTLTLAVCQNISFMTIGGPVHPFVSIVLSIVMLRLFYRELGWKTRLLALVFQFVVIAVSDALSVALSELVLSYETMREGPIYYKLILWPVFLLFIAIAFMVKRRRLLATHIVRVVNEATDRTVLTFIVLVGIELFTLSMYMIHSQVYAQSSSELLFGFNLVTITAVTIMCARLIVLAKRDAVEKARSVYLGELLQLFATARGQRHDFVNHVQTMYAMLQLGKHTQLQAYMQEIVDEVRDISDQSTALALPALAALIQAKSAFAADQRVRFEVTIPNLPVEQITVNTFDLISMTRGLLELAFDQILLLPSNKRKLSFDILGEAGQLVIRIVAYHASSTLPNAVRSKRSPELAAIRRQARLCNAKLAVHTSSVGDAYELLLPLKGA
jgi:hypothetical protein